MGFSLMRAVSHLFYLIGPLGRTQAFPDATVQETISWR
jgi:hypothetical protein